MTVFLVFLGLLAAGGLGLWLLFYRTCRKRDLTRRPKEERFGLGFKKALLIYQPSNRGKNVPIVLALARALAAAGHSVTVNVPSPVLDYDPMEYDYLIFGGSAYMGEVGRPLMDYLARLKFKGKKVLLFVVGDMEKAPELAGLRLRVPGGNSVRSIKIRPGEGNKLNEFALG